MPSHVGILFNEKVDFVAKEATEKGATVDLGLTPKEALNMIKNKLKREWNERYKNWSVHFGKYFFKISPEISAPPFFFERLEKH